MNTSIIHRSIGATALTAMTTLGLTGCGGNSSSGSTGAAPSVSTSKASAPSTLSSSKPMSDSSPASTSVPPSAQSSSKPSTSTPAPVATHKQLVTASPKSAAKTTSAPAPTSVRPAPVVAAGAPGAICYKAYRPNGHENWTAFVGKNVSIPFCTNVAKAAMNNIGAAEDYGVQAVSPTGRTISMHCHIYDASITCSGGNDAGVEIGLNTGF